MHKQALYRTLKKLLPIVYGSATIPQSRLTAEFFDNWKQAKKLGKLFGPRAAQAQADEREVLYYHSDHLGSTRLITLQSGAVYQYLNYLPFGKALEGYQQSSYILPGWAQSKRSFTGQEIDRTTGLMFYQSRFYDPEIGRFIQPDDAVGGNRYAYVLNNPLKFSDPTGHSWVSEWATAIGEGQREGARLLGQAIVEYQSNIYAALAVGGLIGGLPGLAVSAMLMVQATAKFAGQLYYSLYLTFAPMAMVVWTVYNIVLPFVLPLVESYMMARTSQAGTAQGSTQGTETPAEDPAAESDVAAGGSQADASAGGTPTEASPAGGSAPSTSLDGYTGGVSTEGPVQSVDPFANADIELPTSSSGDYLPPGATSRKDCILQKGGCVLSVEPNSNANGAAPWYEVESFSEVNANDPFIKQAAAEYDVDPDLVRAVMQVETTHGYADRLGEAVDRNKSIRPMNINTVAWGDEFGTREQLYEKATNVRAGADMLARIQANLPAGSSIAQTATLYNNLNATRVSDYGARVQAVYYEKPWRSQ